MSAASSRRRNAALLVLAAAAGGTLAYKAMESRAAKKLQAAVTKYSEALALGGRSAAILARDFHAYIESEDDELPRSLRQVVKIAESPEVTSCAANLLVALAERAGLLAAGGKGAAGVGEEGEQEAHHPGSAPAASAVVDKVLDKVFSERGVDLASLLIGRAVRSTMETYFDLQERRASSGDASPSGSGGFEASIPGQLCEFASTERGRRLVTETVSAFVVNAVGEYCDKTAGVNYYEDMVGSVCNPRYRTAVSDLASTMCREAVTTYVAASRSNLSVAPVEVGGAEASKGGGLVRGTPLDLDTPARFGQHRVWAGPPAEDRPAPAPRYVLALSQQGAPAVGPAGPSPWIGDVAAVVKIPEARLLAIGMAGAASGEAMRALWGSLRGEAHGKGAEGARGQSTQSWAEFAAAKSLVGISVILALLLHVQNIHPVIDMVGPS